MRKLTDTQKNIAFGVGAGVLVFGGYKIYRALQKPNINKQTKDFNKATQTLPSGGTINIIEVARQLGIDLGYAYAWYDPRRATENDDAAKKLLLSVPKPLIPFVVAEYGKLYNRNLQTDLQTVLDDYASVRHLFV